MAVIVAGISHRGAGLAVRERIVYRASELAPTIARLRDLAYAREGVLLSTCNRTEFYIVEGGVDAMPAIWQLLSERLGEEASTYGYVRRDRDAVAHLFHVASGLDSMVVGEAQIHGQVRDAWTACRAHAGAVLNRLFQSSLQVAGRVRSETTVGRGAASVSSAALQLARQIFGSLAGRRAMVLGAGASSTRAYARRSSRTELMSARASSRRVTAPSPCTTTNAGQHSAMSTLSFARPPRRAQSSPWNG